MREELKNLRKTCLQMAHAGRDGNLQSVFSSLEILWMLYNRVMNWSPAKARDPERDYFLISKGQATMGQFAVLSETGLFSREELMTFCKADSRFSMQADRTKFTEGGIESSAGSLGHGFPMAVGVAMAHKIRGDKNRVFVLAGDGEMNEGTMWESAMFAAAKQLNNLCLIIDDNHSIGKMIDIGDIDLKMRAFGFVTAKCNGHDTDDIASTIETLLVEAELKQLPACLIAKTIRGYGSETLMKDPSWFHRFPTAEELQALIEEVDSFCENR